MRLRIDLKIFIFLIVFYFTKQIEIYAYIMIFCIIHELGHLLAGIFLKMKPEKIDLMPFGLSVQFKLLPEDYNNKIMKSNILQIKKIIIALSGPIINCIIIILAYFLELSTAIKSMIIYSNIIIVIFNLIPIYPLDGGRILKGILNIIYGNLKTERIMNRISNIMMIFITVVCAFIIYILRNIAIIITLVYLWYLIINENKKYKIKERIYITLQENN